MRVISRFALVAILLILAVTPAFAADANCPLTLVSTNPPTTGFDLSATGVFRSNNLVYVLRGQVLTTYNVTALGDMSIAREDFIGSLAAREQNSSSAFLNGYLYVSSRAGLEIFDLRNVRAGGGAPILVSRTAGLSYERLAINGTRLAGLHPATLLPCYPNATFSCSNQIDLIDISNPAVPTRIGGISSLNQALFRGFNDIAFNNGFLWTTTDTGTFGFNTGNPTNFALVNSIPQPGRFLGSNGANILAIGDDDSIHVVTFGANAQYSDFAHFTIPGVLHIDRANDVVFHPQMWIDDANGRLITMIDERDPLTLNSARTIAFDVFDFTVLRYEGAAPRNYETISTMLTDEVKYNPVAVGPMVYTVGPRSGLQTWGACDQVAGRIETTAQGLTCGGAEIHGWVTGTQKIVNVEVFVDATPLGSATLNTGSPRIDISSSSPVSNWRINVNLDLLSRGEHTLRVVGTDILGNRRQFASERIFFAGPGQNCSTRRRSAR